MINCNNHLNIKRIHEEIFLGPYSTSDKRFEATATLLQRKGKFMSS